MPRLTDDQRADRRNYLGATDIAQLATGSAFELYLEKTGQLDPEARFTDDDRGRLERGHRLEAVALDWHADIAGLRIERVHRDIAHPRLPFIVVHPDARVRPWAETRRLLEVKTATRVPDVLPRRWEAQVQAQMAATGAQAVDIIVLTFNGPPTPIRVDRDEALIGALEQLATTFWQRVQDQVPPPVDGSHAASKWLDRLPWSEAEIVATPAQADALARLLDLRAQAKVDTAEDAAIVNALKLTMAGATRLYAPGVGRVLYTAPTTHRTVSWKEVATVYRRLIETLRDDDSGDVEERVAAAMSDAAGTTSLDDIESLYTTVDTDWRSFRPTALKESEL